MFVAGLTGGIGSGKTTFASLLAERGAQIIDADALARDALRPDQPAWHSVVSQFGDEILQANSLDIDRKRLAAIVFSEPNKLAALNAIVHPVIIKGIADHLERLANSGEIVVLDAALIAELGLEANLDALIAVTAAKDVRKQRLQGARDMDPLDIEARMEAQMDPDEVAARADIVVRNDGGLEELVREADRVWAEL
ncbi:MAG TPA: dephospho-CoA kinase, partial [Actinomycetota bacterium]|nr:dephospho-CoA kinase [Actinomycetota bacterium]